MSMHTFLWSPCILPTSLLYRSVEHRSYWEVNSHSDVKKLNALYEIWWLIILSRTACHWSHPDTDECNMNHHILCLWDEFNTRRILLPSTSRTLEYSLVLSFTYTLVNIFMVSILCGVPSPSSSTWIDLPSHMLLIEKCDYEFWCSSLRIFLHPAVTLSWSRNIFLSTLFSYIFNVCSSLRQKENKVNRFFYCV
jgi:hypothetical protein